MTRQLDDLTFHLNRLFGRVGRVVGGAVLAFLAWAIWSLVSPLTAVRLGTLTLGDLAKIAGGGIGALLLLIWACRLAFGPGLSRARFDQEQARRAAVKQSIAQANQRSAESARDTGRRLGRLFASLRRR